MCCNVMCSMCKNVFAAADPGFDLTTVGVVFVMLWSQIKLTSYDLGDLHITGEFDNRPDTGRFLRVFSCVVTYRSGAVWRYYMKTSADARSGPAGVVRDQPDTVRCPSDFTQFSRAMMNTFISKFIPLKKYVVKIRKIAADSDSDGDENHTNSRLQNF